MSKRLRRIFRPLAISLPFFGLIGLFILIVFWHRIVNIVAAGYGGVHWSLFAGGTRTDQGAMREGLHVILP